MFHTKIRHDEGVDTVSAVELRLREFLADNHEALANGASLLAGRRGARLVSAIDAGLEQPGRLTRRLIRLLLELRSVLLLENAEDEEWDDIAALTVPNPEDPVVHDLCMLADSLDQALREAGLIRSLDEPDL